MSVTITVVNHKLKGMLLKKNYPNASKPKEILSDKIIETKTFY